MRISRIVCLDFKSDEQPRDDGKESITKGGEEVVGVESKSKISDLRS